MTVYQPGDHEAELMLGQCYVELLRSGDLAKLWVEPTPSLSQFFANFRPPNVLLFEHDLKGIFFLAWVEPSLKGCFFAMWIREDRRHSGAAYRAVLKSLTATLQHFPVVLGVTGHEHLVAEHEKLGYTLKCRIDHLFGSDRPGWVLQVDAERIYERVRRHVGWNEDERGWLAELRVGIFDRPDERGK